jgi:hypothetical protein
VNKRTSEALDVTGAALGAAADSIVLTTKTLALKTERRIKGAAHKVDKEVSKACSKVVGGAKELRSVCDSKAGMLKQTFSKICLFGR